MTGSPAIFLDRDGVICENMPEYVRCWEDFRFIPGVLDAMNRLNDLSMPIVVISNQSAVGRGLMRMEDLEDINTRMIEAVQIAGGRIDRVYICPHTPHDSCNCRKPKPGLLTRAADELDLDLASSILVGDSASDIEAGLRVGMKTILVLTGRGSDQLAHMIGLPGNFSVKKDFPDAVEIILKEFRGDQT